MSKEEEKGLDKIISEEEKELDKIILDTLKRKDFDINSYKKVGINIKDLTVDDLVKDPIKRHESDVRVAKDILLREIRDLFKGAFEIKKESFEYLPGFDSKDQNENRIIFYFKVIEKEAIKTSRNILSISFLRLENGHADFKQPAIIEAEKDVIN